ncbi:hypothetical protein SELSPUOL_01588 [Selenomonas sputigena ATCC 35185]|uniref:Uncharacterized protein n=1 Tax=Selenomonas sputigena (strain ATCC 35185 / DSM 20758 / CCUG 44933 / VPI D19B-28) TaxID=546271 RepID=C9LVU3_SELS3|nr:hypothetical protein SELSPUOL_01588 [Selenomonas sputigena ATCC 35185]
MFIKICIRYEKGKALYLQEIFERRIFCSAAGKSCVGEDLLYDIDIADCMIGIVQSTM